MAFDKLLAMRGKKVDARGVEVQGELDLAGQRMADVVWKGIGMSDDDVADNKLNKIIKVLLIIILAMIALYPIAIIVLGMILYLNS